MSKNYIIPKVEKRLSAWLEIQERNARHYESEENQISITISREFGCQGYPLAAELKTELEMRTVTGWTVFDKALINKISEDNQISRHLLENLGERSRYLDYVISSLMPGWKGEEEAYELMTKTIFSIAKQGNAIFVGHGAFAVTQGLKNCYHYRLIAPLEFRVKTYASLAGVTINEAEKIVQESDSNRNSTMQDIYNSSFSNNEFNMIFNNSRMTVENIAKTIMYSLRDVLIRS
ncbi:cytidylate kinase-like family protein [bacterium]|nr:cytidylate kinase-like family protein [bacterium]